MKIETPCVRCGEWFPVGATELCPDCGEQLCGPCAFETAHAWVHELPPDEFWAEIWPQGTSYLRCADTPYSIYTVEDAA